MTKGNLIISKGKRKMLKIRLDRVCRFGGIIFLFLVLALVARLDAKGFLRTQGHDMVDESGEKVFLRGVGLGNWLLPEGYMWKFGRNGDRPRKIEKIVSDLIGEDEAQRFWLEFRKRYITEEDIERIAEVGFNSVRPALNARRFLTEDENPEWVEEGFLLLDNLVEWCKKHDVYVIIDMHGAPGGQTGANIDDSPNDEPGLFMDERNENRLVDLWVKIAERYKDEPTVAAYDLLNEPLPDRTGAAAKYADRLEPMYRRITEAIRRVDKNHMITLEGVDWANDWSVFTKPFDGNIFYQFHYYCWDRPLALRNIDQYLEKRNEFNTPVWVGETGENNNTIYWGTTQYFEANNIGWSFWPWKKMDTQNTPYSIVKPAGWDEIREYSRDGEQPSREHAQKAFDELLENIKLENCVFFTDVVNAIFRRIPGKVEAENYGHGGFNTSYFVKNTAENSEYYRPSEPVQVQRIESGERRRSSQQYIVLQKDEWTAYHINSLAPNPFNLIVRAKAESPTSSFEISLADDSRQIDCTDPEWSELPLESFKFKSGVNTVKVKVTDGVLNVDWLDFKEE